MERSRRPRSRGRGRGSYHRRKKTGYSAHTPAVAPCQSPDRQPLDSRVSGRNTSLSHCSTNIKSSIGSKICDKNVIRVNPPAQLQPRLEFMRTKGLGHVIMSNAPITRSMVNSQNPTSDVQVSEVKKVNENSIGDKSVDRTMDENKVSNSVSSSETLLVKDVSAECTGTGVESTINSESKPTTPEDKDVRTEMSINTEIDLKSSKEKAFDPKTAGDSQVSGTKPGQFGHEGQGQMGQVGAMTGLGSSAAGLFTGLGPLTNIDAGFLQNPGSIIGEHERGDIRVMSDALNKIHAVMVMNCQILSAYKIDSDNKISELALRSDRVETDVSDLKKVVADQKNEIVALGQVKAPKQDLVLLEQKYDNLKSYCEEMFANQSKVIENQQKIISNFDLDMLRMAEMQQNLGERQNVYEIKQNQLILTIDGLPEEREKSTSQVIIDRLNADAKANMELSDFTNAYRVGKPRKSRGKGKGKKQPPAPPPRQIKVFMASTLAKDSVLACRGNLKQNEDRSFVWINEEHPDDYRRRKIRFAIRLPP